MHEVSWFNLGSVSRYERNLPHWRQEGAVYFVTFRLADSIPRAVMRGWMHDRSAWLAARGITMDLSNREREARYAAIPEGARRAYEREQTRKYFIELDKCHGACPLRKTAASKIVSDALQFHVGTRLIGGDFVVMPNHVHCLMLPLEGHALEDILQSVKVWSSRRINALLGRKGTLWQRESYDHIVRDAKEFERVRAYIRENPTKARLRPGEFHYHRSGWPTP